MFFLKAVVIWVVMVFAAIANGIFRERVLTPNFGDVLGLPLSGVLLSLLILVITYRAIECFKGRVATTYIALGAFWVVLTLSFEYGVGYFVRGMSIGEVSEIFDVSSGNLFTVVVIVTLISPVIFAHTRGYIRSNK